MKIMIGIPVYNGNLPIETARCLLDEQMLATKSNNELTINFLPNCSHPAMGRNQLSQQFVDSDCDRLVFLDSDVTFEIGSLLKIAHFKYDFVGGAYRYKTDQEQYPVGWLDKKELWANKDNLIEVSTLPTGFLSLSKNVFNKLKEASPDRYYNHFGKKAHCWFQMPFTMGVLFGEDSYFCTEWRALGNKIYLDPELNLTHWQYDRPYKGHIGNWLKSRV